MEPLVLGTQGLKGLVGLGFRILDVLPFRVIV